ncbi:MAG TPA: response regulator [Opitutaceae bacterium]|nr:response regulator [Opitutaceae bacterium]
MPSVLFIEDSRTFQRLMPKYLPEDYRLTIVDNLAAGWESIQTDQFDLVITDFMFPQGDAFELIFQARHRFSPQQLPIIVLTSVADRFLISKLFVAGVNATVSKPPNVPAFRELIAKMLVDPWVQRPDFPCEDAHLFTWGTADEFVVFCPNLNLFTRGPTQQSALDAMQERIHQHTRSGATIPVITTPKQTLFFSQVECPAHPS